MAEEQQGDRGATSMEPLETEPGLRWLSLWAHNPQFAVFFEHPNAEGEIREVRIRKSPQKGSFLIQFGFVPRNSA